jgi:hypothetical protein
MYNPEQKCWVLNMGGRHGTPGICSAENFVGAVRSRLRRPFKNGAPV